MIIQWNDKWRFNSDAHQWIVERFVSEKTGWRPVAFIEDLCHAVGFVVVRDIRAIEGEFPPDACGPIIELQRDVQVALQDIRKSLGLKDSDTLTPPAVKKIRDRASNGSGRQQSAKEPQPERAGQ